MKRFTSPTLGVLLLSFAQGACGGAGNDSAASGSSSAGAAGLAEAGSFAGGVSPSTNGTLDGSAGATEDDTDPSGGSKMRPTGAPDADQDGVSDDRDLCPGTRSGVPVNANGCDAKTDLGSQVAWGQSVPATALRAVPSNGSVEENGFMNFVVDANGRFPMVFRALLRNVDKLEQGFHVTGTLLLDVPGGTVTLADADVTFESSASASDGIATLHGNARVPFPDFGAPESLELEAPLAQIGLEYGEGLADLKAPLVDDRRYLYFTFSDELSAKFGDLEVAMPAGTEHTLVLDHTDPMFFMRASLTGIPGMPIEIKDAGVGFSRQGLMPFTPTHTWGLGASTSADASVAFSGQMYLEMSGGIEIPETPLMLTGEAVNVIDLDPARTGHTVFTDPKNGLRLGANRALGVKIELIPGTAGLEMDMAEASLDLSLLKDAKTAFVSGIAYPGRSFLNDVVPITPAADVKVAAAIASPVSDSRFALAGDVSLALSKLNSFTELSLSDVPLAQSSLTIDKSGLTVHGDVGGSFLSAVGVGAGATFDAVFPGAAASSDWCVDVNGDLSVSGVHLSGTTSTHLDRTGVAVNGRLASALGGIAIAGRITSSGVDLSGAASVSIPIVAGHTELQTFVNGSVCGYETVQSAALCGVESLKGFAACGVNYAKACVLHHHCGTPTCAGPAKSCSDLSKPLSCPQSVTVPSFNYGTFTGTVKVSIGSNGISSSLVGAYCPVSGSCQELTGTSVDLTSSKACVQVPGIDQSFCASF